jgi:hypothetical protein
VRRSTPPRADLGQTATETIVTIVLIALVAVVLIGVYGRTVMSNFLCAARAVATGEAIASACGEKAGGKDDGGPEKPGEGSGGKGGGGAPRPSTGSSSGAGNPDTAQERLNQALETLGSVGTGKRIARTILDNNVTVVFASGEGSFFSSDSVSGPTITLDDRFTTEEIIFALAHESNHLDFEVDGRTANPRNFNLPDEYVDAMLDEETASVVREIDVKKDLEAEGGTFSPLPFQFEEAYDTAYNQELERLETEARRNRGPRIPRQEARAAARRAGVAAVKRKFASGEVTNSIDGRPYTEYYGEAWDRAVLGTGGGPVLRLP